MTRGATTPGFTETPHILVTGGTGIYGRSLVRTLASEGHSVRVLTRGDNSWRHPKISAYRGDMARLEDLREAIRGCDTVFHCAGEKFDREKMTSVNIAGTRSLFSLATELQVKLFCHLSTVGVTGKTRLKIVDEYSPCNPTNPYEETKLAAEEIVGSGIDAGYVVILRPTNIFTPATLGPFLAGSIRHKIAMLIKGNENAHFVYVEDVVAAAMHCWRNTSKRRVDVFNVSSDEDAGVTYREIQAAMLSLIPTAPSPIRIAAPQMIPYWSRRIRGNDANRGDVIYSSAKLRKAGFSFPYGLSAGLTHAATALRNMVVD
jgi:nucleoside-diphosphate-sugar epimerase